MYAGTVTIGARTWNVNVATTQAELAAGFSNVASTPANTGILFNLGGAHTNITIDMQSMNFPLDIAFMDGNGKIVDIVQNLQPLQNHVCLVSCNYFLEVNAGELTGVNVGDTAIIPVQVASTGINISSIIEMMLVVMLVGVMSKLAKTGENHG